MSGASFFITRDALAMAAHHMFFTSAKATTALGRRRPYREALVDALAWFKTAGMIR